MKNKNMILIIILILNINLLSACNLSDNNIDNNKNSDISNKINNMIISTINSNNADYNYLLYNEKFNEIKLYFGFDISLVSISKLELYKNEDMVCDNVELINQYDNVLTINIKSFIKEFNIIKIYDGNGTAIEYYVGEYYLENIKENKNDDENDNSFQFKSKVSTFENYIEIEVKIDDKNENKYNMQFCVHKEIKDIFDEFYQKIENSDGTYVIKYKLTFKNKEQISPFINTLYFDVLGMKINKITNEYDYFTVFSIPIEMNN